MFGVRARKNRAGNKSGGLTEDCHYVVTVFVTDEAVIHTSPVV